MEERNKIIEEIMNYIEETNEPERLRQDLQCMINGPEAIIDLDITDVEICYQGRKLPKGKVFRIKMVNEMREEQMIQEIKNCVESLEHKMSGIIAGLRGNISLFDVEKFISPVAKTAGDDVNIIFSASFEPDTETELLLIAM